MQLSSASGGRISVIVAAANEALDDPPVGRVPDLWDGRAADRIANTKDDASEIDASVVACLEVLGVEATEVEALVEVLRTAASESTFD